MFRPPHIGLLALLSFAALGCSESVAPSGATLSGFVYADDNANGVRDSCDSRDGPRQIVTVKLLPLGDRGTGREVNTAKGPWQIDGVAPGEYQLVVEDSLRRPFWSVTSPAQEAETPGYRISVKGYEVVDGLDFGVLAGIEKFLTPGSNLVEIVFDDTDGDGRMDEQECPIGERGFERLEAGLWEITTARAQYGQCGQPGGRDPKVSQGWFLLGVREATGTATVVARVFDDDDGDGVREDGEPLLPKVEVSLSPLEPCIFGVVEASYGEEGEVVFSNLPRGSWSVYVDIVPCGVTCWRGPRIFQTTPDEEKEGFGRASIHVRDGETEAIDFGFQIVAPSSVHVEVVEDVNGDGRALRGEPRIQGIPVCWGSPPDAVEYPPGIEEAHGWESCQESNRDGVVDFGNLFEGVRRFGIDLPARLEAVWVPSQPFVDITVVEGEALTVTLLIHRP